MKTLHRTLCCLAMVLIGFRAAAADKVTVTINNQLISAYRTVDLESAKKDAVAAHKPIAWIASDPKVLDGTGNISQNGTRGATLHAFLYLKDKAILVFMDAFEENHKVLEFVDAALHTPNPHYTAPSVAFLDPEATKVLNVVTFEPDVTKRARALAAGLEKAKSQLSGAQTATSKPKSP